MSTWKAVERAIAKILPRVVCPECGHAMEGERVPVTGRQRGSAPDIEHPWLSTEIKHRKELPAWLLDAMAQAEASQRGMQLPTVILHKWQMPYDQSLVVVRLSDFVEWFGDPWEPYTQEPGDAE